ncbi:MULTISPECIES: S41 family peptidase [Bacillus]|uniref:S41 family peptidase n=1 Tax=Bacillus TaxID=1386 RepID=UPI00031C3B27|nr:MULTISPECIES: S41 family peptidase [Bacillus]
MNKRWVLPLAITLSLLVGLVGGLYMGPNIFLKWDAPKNDKLKQEPTTNKDDQLELVKVEQVYQLIKEHYIEKMTDDDLITGAIEGMVAKLKDPYSVYMDKEAANQFRESLDSSFEGIGTEIGVEDDKIIIVSPYKNSPAEEAGLKAKDEILSVNDESVQGLNVQDVSVKIRGKKGSKVKLEIKRPGVTKILTFEIIRDTIPIETVHSKIKEESGEKLGYIEITQFSSETAADFKRQLKVLEVKDIKGLIIDVRGNPGGLLSSVDEIVSELIINEKPYLQIERRNGEHEKLFSKLKEKKPYNIAVLIDNGSASASEILAAALQEAGGYELIGDKTYGKGTVQQAVKLDDGSNIKLTLAKWLTPDGNWIHKTGIEPTIAIKQPKLFNTQAINIEKTLKRDMTGDQIQHAQDILRVLGYEPGRNDGYFDLKTEIAVKAFQNNSGVKATGKIDVKTARLLEQKVSSKMKDDDNDLQLRTALRYLVK